MQANLQESDLLLRFGVKWYTPHRADKFPIAWKDSRILVNSTQWDFRKQMEIAHDILYKLLYELLHATGGWVVQRATMRTSRTKIGQMLLTNEMCLPGIRDCDLMLLGQNAKRKTRPTARSPTAPLTFIVGN